jgi:hypothetical protein
MGTVAATVAATEAAAATTTTTIGTKRGLPETVTATLYPHRFGRVNNRLIDVSIVRGQDQIDPLRALTSVGCWADR